MNVKIAFDIHAASTLPDAVDRAQEMLAKFLGSDGDPDLWRISLYCTPEAEVSDGTVVVWRCEVEAVRGVRHGP